MKFKNLCTAPEYLSPADIHTHFPMLFLAGGITGCPDWQKTLCDKLLAPKAEKKSRGIIYNPRRPNFPMDDPSSAHQQITWEFESLEKADIICFWFPKEQIQPIALFELGRWSWVYSKVPSRDTYLRHLLVGVEPGYPREQDVRIQLDLLGIKTVYDNLDSLADAVLDVAKFRDG